MVFFEYSSLCHLLYGLLISFSYLQDWQPHRWRVDLHLLHRSLVCSFTLISIFLIIYFIYICHLILIAHTDNEASHHEGDTTLASTLRAVWINERYVKNSFLPDLFVNTLY